MYATNEEIPIVWWKILAVEDTQNTKDFKLFKETKKDFFWVGVHDFYSAHKKWHRGRDIPMFIAFTSIIRGIDETLGYIKGGVDPSKIFSSIDEWVGDGEIYITQGEKIIYDKRIKKQGEKIKKDKEITISEYSSLMNLNFSVSLNSAAIYAQGVKSALPLFVLLLAASFLLLVAIRAILKTILGRLEQAVYYTNKVEAGDSEVVFPESGGDEVGQLISSMNLLLDKLRKNAQEKILYEKSEKKALILALQYQVNPHFLFNTLNWLQLSFEMGAEKENLSKAISMLSQLLRYNLSGDPLGSIEEEVANVKTYVALMNMRKNHTILIHIDLSSIEEEIAVMRFMFQPLVENAIQHGLVKTKPLNVYITGKQVGNQITFYVKNDGFPISTKGLEILEENKEKRKEGKGIGLANIAARLKFLYGEKSSLAITSNEKETVIEISFSIL